MNYASSILGLLPGGRRAAGIGQLISKIEAYLPPDQVERVREAFDYAEAAHKGQKRKSGEAFITHPVAVADILADLHLDGATIQAAAFHKPPRIEWWFGGLLAFPDSMEAPYVREER